MRRIIHDFSTVSCSETILAKPFQPVLVKFKGTEISLTHCPLMAVL